MDLNAMIESSKSEIPHMHCNLVTLTASCLYKTCIYKQFTRSWSPHVCQLRNKFMLMWNKNIFVPNVRICQTTWQQHMSFVVVCVCKQQPLPVEKMWTPPKVRLNKVSLRVIHLILAHRSLTCTYTAYLKSICKCFCKKQTYPNYR